MIYASGSATGAPLGGFLVDSVGWRWAFLVQTPMCAIAFISVYIILELPPLNNSHWKENLGRVDFAGALALVSAVFSLLLGLDHGSNVSWHALSTIVPLTVSAVLFVVFVLIEIFFSTEPFAPGHIIFERSLFACYFCNFFAFGSWLATIFYIPLFFQVVEGLSATQAGVRLLPLIAASVSGSLFSGIVMQKTGRYYWLTVLCYIFMTIGTLSIALFSGLITKNIGGMIIGMIIGAFSAGIGVTTTLIGLSRLR